MDWFASALDVGQTQMGAAIWFTLAIALLDRFDISLPRGDSMGVSGALVAAAAVVCGLPLAAAGSMAALLIAQVGRGDSDVSRLRAAAFARVGALAGLAVWMLLPLPDATVSPLEYVAALVITPTVYLVLEIVAAQAYMALESGRPLPRLLAGNLRRQAPVVAAQVSAAVLAVITYPDLQAWSLVLVVMLLLLMRQSVALLLEIRETYRTTVEVLVEVAEGQDSRRKGHADRTAQIAREIAMHLGWSAADVERVSYAALLHDIDALSDTQRMEPEVTVGQSARVFRDTAFFDDVLPVLRLCDGCGLERDSSELNLTTAMMVAIASDIDASAHPEVLAAHSGSALARVSGTVPAGLKAKVVAAALELGYQTPAVR